MSKNQKSMSGQKNILLTEKRTMLGKKVKQLREKGLIPANIFGPDFASQSVSTPTKEFVNIYKIVKETGVVYVKLDEKEIPCLITAIQRHPISRQILHVDFRKIDLSKKIISNVPVEIKGTSPAVTQLGGVLITQTNSISIEALPQDIPSTIVVDISVLKEIGNEIKVKDIKAHANVVIKTDPEKVVVSVTAHKEESVIAETTTEAPEVLTAKPEGEEVVAAETGKPDAKEAKPKEKPGQAEVKKPAEPKK